MAAEGDVDLDLEAEENCTGKPAEKPRKHDSGAADLERVTDYAEEKEISSSDLETAMSVIGDRRSREQKAKQERAVRKYLDIRIFVSMGWLGCSGTPGQS
ncbi:huntingtin-interacting protein K isoform X3 [Epinephelus lanceolatus]